MKTFTFYFLKSRSGKTFLRFPEIGSRVFSGLLFVIFYVFTLQTAVAQNIKTYSDVINGMQAPKDKAVSFEENHLKSLVFDLQPKLYIHKHEEKRSSDEPPVCINADANAADVLYETKPLYERVELITIILNSADDLDFVYDLSRLKNFPKLKYIQFLCSFECDPSQIKLNQEKSETGLIVFYRISIPQ
jgi:hypothetical protein